MSEGTSGPIFGLGPRQRVAVASAITVVSAAIIVAAVFAVGWLASAFLSRFSNVFLPLVVAAVLALVVKPYFRWWHERVKAPKVLALLAVLLTIALPVVGFGWFFGAILVDQIGGLFSQLPRWWDFLIEESRRRWPEVQAFLETNPWAQRAREMAESRQSDLLAGAESVLGDAFRAGKGVIGGMAALASWAVLPVYFIFFLMADMVRPASLGRYLPFLKQETRKDVVYLVEQFVDIIVAFFRDQLVIAFLQGLLLAIGFSIIGLDYGFALGMLLGLINIIPYLGSIIGLGICLPLAYFQNGGGWGLLIGVIVVFVVVQNIEGYLLTPRIMGDRTGLHPVAIIFAVFFWGSALGGILGMLLAIPLTAFLVVFLRLAREKYIKELV